MMDDAIILTVDLIAVECTALLAISGIVVLLRAILDKFRKAR